MSLQTVIANDAKTHFGEFIDRVQKGPVRITRRGRVVGVMVSTEDDEVMRTFFADRLQNTLTQTATHAKRQGLMAAKLAAFLANER